MILIITIHTTYRLLTDSHNLFTFRGHGNENGYLYVGVGMFPDEDWITPDEVYEYNMEHNYNFVYLLCCRAGIQIDFWRYVFNAPCALGFNGDIPDQVAFYFDLNFWENAFDHFLYIYEAAVKAKDKVIEEYNINPEYIPLVLSGANICLCKECIHL